MKFRSILFFDLDQKDLSNHFFEKAALYAIATNLSLDKTTNTIALNPKLLNLFTKIPHKTLVNTLLHMPIETYFDSLQNPIAFSQLTALIEFYSLKGIVLSICDSQQLEVLINSKQSTSGFLILVRFSISITTPLNLFLVSTISNFFVILIIPVSETVLLLPYFNSLTRILCVELDQIDSQLLSTITDSFKLLVELQLGLFSNDPQLIDRYKKVTESTVFTHDDKFLLQKPLDTVNEICLFEIYRRMLLDENKYKTYCVAIETFFESYKDNKAYVVYAGCGTGGILYQLFRSKNFRLQNDEIVYFKTSDGSKIIVSIYAVEPNKYACATVLAQCAYADDELFRFFKLVKFINSDIVDVAFDHPISLFFSEMLGSFGNNEQYCDIVYNLRKIRHKTYAQCVFIPNVINEYIYPVQSFQLREAVAKLDDYDYMYVVQTNCIYPLTDSCLISSWSTTNGYVSENLSNTKLYHESSILNHTYYCEYSQQTTFLIADGCCLDGFIGYFESSLISEIKLLPFSAEHRSTSWYPIFFPIKPIFFLGKNTVFVTISRTIKPGQIEYRWTVETKASLKQSHFFSIPSNYVLNSTVLLS